MKKSFISAILAALSLVSLTACGKKDAPAASTSSVPEQTSSVITTIPEITLPETTEEEKVVKTEAETREELIAGIITAFCNKDEATFNAYIPGNASQYKTAYNQWCTALSMNNIDYKTFECDPSSFETYYLHSGKSVYDMWYITNAVTGNDFSIYVCFNDFDYTTNVYSISKIKILEKADYEGLKAAADAGTPDVSQNITSLADISEFLS